MEDEDVKQYLDRVERIAQCPVCLELVRAPIVLCVNGHVTCGQCRNNAANCHVCRQPFSNVSPRVVEELLSVLPQLCPNEMCGVVTILDNHSKYCVYRQIKCRVGNCQWSGAIIEWFEHINIHTSNIAEYQLNGVSTCLRIFSFPGDWKCRYYNHVVEDQYFIMKCWKKGNELYHSFRHVKCERSIVEYRVIVEYKCGQQNMYRSLIEVLPYEDDESMENNAAVFPIDELEELVDEDGHLPVFVTVKSKTFFYLGK
ncbi:E3 ubiquitin-protein ligase Siah2-like [Macrosteles quadrilineatus]|uniref:E3 ubiquitin-protein ligase Siah2-like n=1 Tax=Macrosteles quadrilineatus TaxID=74068 RepID=UPI0023E1B4F0|nr:E3 ubiquitin-protein ligase Siah2-like [Macrosteles quadrilineatus]